MRSCGPHGVEQQAHVGNGASHGADDVEIEQHAGQHVLARPHRQRGLQSDESGVRRGPTDRATAVLCDGERRDAGGDGGDGAATRAARRERRRPGIAGDAEHGVARVTVVGELRHVGLAENQRAGSAGARDGKLVMAAAVVAQRRRAVGRRQVGRQQAVLDRERDAVERRTRVATRVALGGRLGVGEDRRIAPRHHGVEPWIDRIHPRQARARDVDGRQAAFAIAALQFGCRQLPGRHHGCGAIAAGTFMTSSPAARSPATAPPPAAA
jgi:hypothetical protein